MSSPIILVPGFWLGAWAWDEVAAHLRESGHEVTALTLPGLESVDADRSGVTLADHAAAIADAVRAAPRPPVLAVHSGAGSPGYAASDAVAGLLAAVVYVDTGPAKAAMDPEFDAVELPLPSWEVLTSDQGNSIEGIPQEKLDEFRRRAVPEPGAALRDAPSLVNDARLDVPSIVICCGLTSEAIKGAVEAGYPWVAGLAELRNVEYIDLPTSHWPMWSRPADLAAILGEVAGRDRQ